MLHDKHLPAGTEQIVQVGDGPLRIGNGAKDADAEDRVEHPFPSAGVRDGDATLLELRDQRALLDATRQDHVLVLETLGARAPAQLVMQADARLGAVDGMDARRGGRGEEGHLGAAAGADVEDNSRGGREEGRD